MFDNAKADHAVNFINCLKHTKGRWRGVPFELLSWQDEIIRTLFGTVKENGYRQYNTCYCEIPKKNGKSELAAAIAAEQTAENAPQEEEDLLTAAVNRTIMGSRSVWLCFRPPTGIYCI